MNTSLARPGSIVELHRIDRDLTVHDTSLLLRTDDFRIIQVHLPAGSQIPTYEAHGQVIMHCLEGSVSILALGESHDLKPEQLLYLVVNEPFSIIAHDDSSLLVTIANPTAGREVDVIG